MNDPARIERMIALAERLVAVLESDIVVLKSGNPGALQSGDYVFIRQQNNEVYWSTQPDGSLSNNLGPGPRERFRIFKQGTGSTAIAIGDPVALLGNNGKWLMVQGGGATGGGGSGFVNVNSAVRSIWETLVLQ